MIWQSPGFIWVGEDGAGLLAEFIVRERADLTVMGYDFPAYWLGIFLADSLLLICIPVVILWITVDMPRIIVGYASSYPCNSHSTRLFLLLFFLHVYFSESMYFLLTYLGYYPLISFY